MNGVVRTAPKECPVCLTELDASRPVTSTAAEKPEPVAGDLTFCMYCATALRFDAALELRTLSEDERAEFEQRPEFVHAELMAKVFVQRYRQRRAS